MRQRLWSKLIVFHLYAKKSPQWLQCGDRVCLFILVYRFIYAAFFVKGFESGRRVDVFDHEGRFEIT